MGTATPVYSATSLRGHFSEATLSARWGEKRVKIFLRGKFAAAIVPLDDMRMLGRCFVNARHPTIIKSIRRARQNFASILQEVAEKQHCIEVQKYGIPFVGIISSQYFETLLENIPISENTRVIGNFFKGMFPVG